MGRQLGTGLVPGSLRRNWLPRWQRRLLVRVRRVVRRAEHMLHPRGLGAQVEAAVGGKLLLARAALLVPVDLDAQRAERVDLERVVGEQADRDHAEILQDEWHDLVVAGLVRQPKRQVGVDRVEAVPRLGGICGRLDW